MSKNFKLFMSCDEAVNTCDKSQYGEVSFWEKIKHTIHLLYCKVCRAYTSNNVKLTKLMKSPEVECLKKSEKEQLQSTFQKELENLQ
jgi:hypothetical protein